MYDVQDNRTIFPIDYALKGWYDDVASYAIALEPLLSLHFGTTKMLSGGSPWARAPLLASYCTPAFHLLFTYWPPTGPDQLPLNSAGPGCADMTMWEDRNAKRFAEDAPLDRFDGRECGMTFLTTGKTILIQRCSQFLCQCQVCIHADRPFLHPQGH